VYLPRNETLEKRMAKQIFDTLKKEISGMMLESPLSEVTRLALLPISYFSLPNYAQLEITTRCNLHCQTCIRPKETNSDMSVELYKSIIDQLKWRVLRNRRVDLTGLGEPLLNPNLPCMVRYAKGHDFNVSFTSNFTLINSNHAINLIKAGLDSLYISFDGATEQTFESIRTGASYKKVVDNIKLFAETRKHLNSGIPKLVFMSTISPSNAAEIPQLIGLAESLGIDGIDLFKQIIPEKECVNNLSISQYVEGMSNDKVEIHAVCLDKPPQFCTAVMGCYITFDGKVLPCGALIQMIPREQYSRFQFGDLKRNSFSDIWFSNSYRQFRTRIILGKHPPLCRSCPMYRSD